MSLADRCDCGHSIGYHGRSPNACSCSNFTRTSTYCPAGPDWTCGGHPHLDQENVASRIFTHGCRAPGCACGTFCPGSDLERKLVLSIAKATMKNRWLLRRQSGHPLLVVSTREGSES